MTKSKKSTKSQKSGNSSKKTKQSGNSRPKLVVIALAVLLLLFLLWKFLPALSGSDNADYIIGSADECKNSPGFITQHNLEQPVAIDFSQRGFTGMRIIEARQDGSGRVLRLPSWDDAGHLGLYTMDREGNIFTTPVPHISLMENVPEEQNKVYKIDSRTGKMEPFVDLPWVKPPNMNNPFGALGLAYDCDTESLYVSSVAGSTREDEFGRIFQIDLAKGEVVDIYEGIDVIGLGIFNTKSGKKLFCGSARVPEIYSLDLDDKGHFKDDLDFVASLLEVEGGSYDKGHRIRFFEDNRMEIKGVDFNYSLMVASDPMRNIYNFKYNEEKDNWDFIGVYKQSGG